MEDTSKRHHRAGPVARGRDCTVEVREAGPQDRWDPSEPSLSPVLREGIWSTRFCCAILMIFNFICEIMHVKQESTPCLKQHRTHGPSASPEVTLHTQLTAPDFRYSAGGLGSRGSEKLFRCFYGWKEK